MLRIPVYYVQIKLIEAIIYGLDCVFPVPENNTVLNQSPRAVDAPPPNTAETRHGGVPYIDPSPPPSSLGLSEPTSLYSIVSDWTLSDMDDDKDDDIFPTDPVTIGVFGVGMSNWTMSDEAHGI
jgi:hypothetical protein